MTLTDDCQLYPHVLAYKVIMLKIGFDTNCCVGIITGMLLIIATCLYQRYDTIALTAPQNDELTCNIGSYAGLVQYKALTN